MKAEFQRFPKEWDVLQFLDVVMDITSKASKIKKENYLEIGRFPVIDQGQAFISGFCDDESMLVDIDEPVIVFGDHTRTFKYVDHPFVLGADGAKVLIPKLDVDKKFLFHYLNQVDIESAGYSRHFKFLKEAYIPLPPIETQKKIAEILQQADTLRQQAQQMQTELDQLAQAIFIDMFGDPVSNPKSYEKRTIGSLTQVMTGSTPSRKNSKYWDKGCINWVKTGEVNGERILDSEELISIEAIEETNCKKFPKDTILVAMYGQGKTRGQVGILGIEAATNQACAAIQPSDSFISDFLFHYLKTQYSELRALGRGGNQENLNLSMVKSYEIIVPSIKEQRSFIEKIKEINLKRLDTTRQISESDALFYSLMQKAFKGELVA